MKLSERMEKYINERKLSKTGRVMVVLSYLTLFVIPGVVYFFNFGLDMLFIQRMILSTLTSLIFIPISVAGAFFAHMLIYFSLFCIGEIYDYINGRRCNIAKSFDKVGYFLIVCPYYYFWGEKK